LRPVRASRRRVENGPEAAQLDAPAFGQARSDLVEEDVDHLLDFLGPQVGIVGRQRLQELGSDHRTPFPRPPAELSSRHASGNGNDDPCINLAESPSPRNRVTNNC
jgi:hypothetical protein